MAEAFLRQKAHDVGLAVESASAGVAAAGTMNPVVQQAMAEAGLAMEGQFPKMLTPEMVSTADRIISMGCGVDAESCPTRFLATEDWELDDPAGQTIERVRAIRDAVAGRVDALVTELIATRHAGNPSQKS